MPKGTAGRSPRNRTLRISAADRIAVRTQCMPLKSAARATVLKSRVICQDIVHALPFLPSSFVDLLVIDPPYNVTRSYGKGFVFRSTSDEAYEQWFSLWFVPLLRVLKSEATVYVCSEWRTSSVVQRVLARHLHVRNRITWEREKGRGAKHNWKNCHEDIWYCTAGNRYTFNVDAVKVRRRVKAPYVDDAGKPKDWVNSGDGNVRDTHPSNLWTDVSVPFWSMPENTDHPTQKAEKLAAKLVLASSSPGDMVMDPFLGSGTTAIVARKLGRGYLGIERDEGYCAMALKRLQRAEGDRSIQGYRNGIFLDRNA
jgi:site-specific DNA-methyltransferase (adenine-specific)